MSSISNIFNNTKYSIKTFNDVNRKVLDSISFCINKEKKSYSDYEKSILYLLSAKSLITTDTFFLTGKSEGDFSITKLQNIINNQAMDQIVQFQNNIHNLDRTVKSLVDTVDTVKFKKIVDDKKIVEEVKRYLDYKKYSYEKICKMTFEEIKNSAKSIGNISSKFNSKNLNFEDQILHELRGLKDEIVSSVRANNIYDLSKRTLKKILREFKYIKEDSLKLIPSGIKDK